MNLQQISPHLRQFARNPHSRITKQLYTASTQFRIALSRNSMIDSDSSTAIDFSITIRMQPKQKPAAVKVIPALSLCIPLLLRQYFHSGRTPTRESIQGRQSNRRLTATPLKPSMIAPQQMPIFATEPGNRNARGAPRSSCCSEMMPISRKLMQKYKKIVFAGPIMKHPTKQNTQVYTQGLQQYTPNQIPIRMYSPTISSTLTFERGYLEAKLLSILSLLMLSFFCTSVQRQRDTIDPAQRQNDMALTDRKIKMIAVVVRMISNFPGLPFVMRKHQMQVRKMIPAAATLIPKRMSLP